MGLGLQGDHGVDLFDVEHVGTVRVGGIELFHTGTFDEGHIIFICGHETVGVLLRCLFDHLEQRHRLFLTVYDECAVEYFVAAVF